MSKIGDSVFSRTAMSNNITENNTNMCKDTEDSMEILKCNSSRIIIRLNEKFSNVTIQASGERIMDWEGFCISTSSIKQIKPIEKVFSIEEKNEIANAIKGYKDFTYLSQSMPVELYEVN